jgi:MGT family glycosyltransferase
MSKIVYLTPPAHGHVNPTLPVVQTLVQRGEQVICYNTQEFRPQLERTGATFRAYADSDLTSAEISRLLAHGNLANITGLILRSTGQILPSLLDALSREAPDLVVFDSIALWGKMAATQLGLRAAASISHLVMDERHMKPLDVLRMVWQILPNVPGLLSARRRLVRAYGHAYPSAAPLFPMRDRLNIVFATRQLQPDTPIIDETFRFVGPSINPQTRSEAFPFDSLEKAPVVYVSLGTIHATRPEFFMACVEAFADSPAQFVLSVGRQLDLGALGAIPSNFIVRPSVPQLDVLQRTDVFITHGGINSVQEGLYYGVPLILIPQQFEQLLNARCVAARGAGLIIDAHFLQKPVTAARLRQALSAVMSEARYREAAGTLQQALRATGGYRQSADELQAYMSQASPAG